MVRIRFRLAGVAGFEPTNDGVRVRCLTAWRHPNAVNYYTAFFEEWQAFLRPVLKKFYGTARRRTIRRFLAHGFRKIDDGARMPERKNRPARLPYPFRVFRVDVRPPGFLNVHAGKRRCRSCVTAFGRERDGGGFFHAGGQKSAAENSLISRRKQDIFPYLFRALT